MNTSKEIELENRLIGDHGARAAQLLALFLRGEDVVKGEDHLDVLFDQVTDLLAAVRDERYRLRNR